MTRCAGGTVVVFKRDTGNKAYKEAGAVISLVKNWLDANLLSLNN